jgi:hypothetical protein
MGFCETPSVNGEEYNAAFLGPHNEDSLQDVGKYIHIDKVRDLIRMSLFLKRFVNTLQCLCPQLFAPTSAVKLQTYCLSK